MTSQIQLPNVNPALLELNVDKEQSLQCYALQVCIQLKVMVLANSVQLVITVQMKAQVIEKCKRIYAQKDSFV